jgi:anthranilate phosphoribosyltransferase
VLGVADNDLHEGLIRAREAIDSGAALEALEHWVALTNRFGD